MDLNFARSFLNVDVSVNGAVFIVCPKNVSTFFVSPADARGRKVRWKADPVTGSFNAERVSVAVFY